jgi:hypothetical protein
VPLVGVVEEGPEDLEEGLEGVRGVEGVKGEEDVRGIEGVRGEEEGKVYYLIGQRRPYRPEKKAQQQ